MAILFNGLESKKWPNNDDDEKVIIVEGQTIDVYLPSSVHKPEKYLVNEDFDLMPVLLEARAKGGLGKLIKGKIEVAAMLGLKPAITIEVVGDIVSVLLVSNTIKSLATSH